LRGQNWVLTVAQNAAPHNLAAEVETTGNPELVSNDGEEELRTSMEVGLMEVTHNAASQMANSVFL